MAIRKHGCGALLLANRCVNPDEHAWTRQLPRGPAILLLQRGYLAPTFPGYWGGPGGLKQGGESASHAAARECGEEFGAEFFPDPEPFYEGEWQDRDLSYFLGDWRAPPMPALQFEEVCGFGWYTRENALLLPLSFRYHEAITQLAA